MAELIPEYGICSSRMNDGEKRLAQQLKNKLNDDYWVWFDIPVGPCLSHPDFIVFHPQYGLLILEVKDWKCSTIHSARKDTWTIWDTSNDGQRRLIDVKDPLEQARQHAHHVVNALTKDPSLRQTGRYSANPACPWGYGVVFAKITRQEFLDQGLSAVIEPHRAICSDEIAPATDPLLFEQRLKSMLPYQLKQALTDVKIDRLRWILFPEVRIDAQGSLFDSDDSDPPEIMRVFDLQQEQLARSLGEGHRVIHGVAGSGKTMILGYRAQYLAKSVTTKPVLVLYFTKPLGEKITRMLDVKDRPDSVQIVHFHKWCQQQLRKFQQELPSDELLPDDYVIDLVQRVTTGLQAGKIPKAQYVAILIDEGHDFKPEWLRILVEVLDPTSNALLLLYDDSQSIYERSRTKEFSFLSVGVQARGRTTKLRVNYRNTKQILHVASKVARDILKPEDRGEDNIPILKPISCGREGEEPRVFRVNDFEEEVWKIADLLKAAHTEGHPWGDMAILCRSHRQLDLCADKLQLRGIPWEKEQSCHPASVGAVRLITMQASKGLEFAVVALAGIGLMPRPDLDEKDEAKLFYVAATRATHKLFITISGDGAFGKLLADHAA